MKCFTDLSQDYNNHPLSLSQEKEINKKIEASYELTVIMQIIKKSENYDIENIENITKHVN